MLHHLSLPVSNLETSALMYDAALRCLGYRRVCEAQGFIGYGETDDEDKFAITQAGPARSAGPGFHLAFAAQSHQAIDAFHAAALQHGARDNGAPGFRPQYGESYYAAFIIDPDGHHIEAVMNPAGAARL